MDALATAFGRLLHWIAERLRRRLSPREGDRIAVFADSLLRYAAAQAAGLSRAGYKVTLVYIDRTHEFGGDTRDRDAVVALAEQDGVELLKLPGRNLRRALPQSFELILELRRRGVRAIVVQSHFEPREFVAALAFPTAYVLHDPAPHTGDEESAVRWPAPLVPWLSEVTATCLVLHSERLRPQVRPMLRSLPMVYVPHGADSPSAPHPLPEKRSLLVVGRLWPYKGADLAVAAFERLPEQYRDATLVVAGKGPVGEELARSAPPRVVVKPGYVPEDELMSLLAQATAVLLPYLDATQSGIGLQAVARGVPCVVSDAGALPDLVAGVAPELIARPGDVDSLVVATERALDHDDALRERLFADVQARFAWPVVGEQLMDELRGLGFPVPPSGDTH